MSYEQLKMHAIPTLIKSRKFSMTSQFEYYSLHGCVNSLNSEFFEQDRMAASTLGKVSSLSDNSLVNQGHASSLASVSEESNCPKLDKQIEVLCKLRALLNSEVCLDILGVLLTYLQ